MNISEKKKARIVEKMKKADLDGMFLRISEDVLYFTGYWPQNHAGAAVVNAEGDTWLLIPELEVEHEFPSHSPSNDVMVRKFVLESGEKIHDLNCQLSKHLPYVFTELGLKEGRVGVEKSIEMVNFGVFQGEVKCPGEPTWNMLTETFPEIQFIDATAEIFELRSIKTTEEISAIQKAVTVACFGFEAARNVLKPGIKESELAAEIEYAIHTKGIGYEGIDQARGYAAVYSGTRSAYQNLHYAHSTARVIEENDPVIIELAAFADGYWSDLTRNLVPGEASAKIKDMFEVTLGAQRAAMNEIQDGVEIKVPYLAAADYFESHGYPRRWPHALGHGVGFAYHEGPPLHESIDGRLESGMVLTIEPGMYIEDVGGVRPEDMIVVTETGIEELSKFYPHRL